jgi:hypothetical protein
MKTISIEIQGISPLLMNRYGGEKPSEPKPPRGKKTQDWIDKKHHQQWTEAAHWVDGKGFHIPPEALEAMLSCGARKIRMGQDFKQCVSIVEDFVPLLVWDGSEKYRPANGTLESYYRREHIGLRGVVIGKARVDRCRPVFKDWSLKFNVSFDESIVTEENIKTALERQQVGDFRPRFGRFKVV